MAAKKGNHVGTFLERATHYSLEQAASGESAAPPNASGNLDKILVHLLKSESSSVPELLKQAGQGAFEFFRSLNTLMEANLVELKEVSGEEIVSLTENGEKVANLAKEDTTQVDIPVADPLAAEKRPSPYERGTRHYENHRVELEQMYPGQYVAICEDQVISNGSEFGDVAQSAYDQVGYQDVFIPHVAKFKKPVRLPSRRVVRRPS